MKGDDDGNDKDDHQVNFFVTDSVIPEPAKTTLIILYGLLITIAGDHHVMTTVMVMALYFNFHLGIMSAFVNTLVIIIMILIITTIVHHV